VPSSIRQRRLHNLGLDRPRFRTAEDVVGWLVAVQSQDFGPAKWSVAMRTRTLDDPAMDRAFAAGEILRTHVLRPTWHFVLPADIRWLQQLTGPRVRRALAYYDRQLELDAAILKRCRALIVRELSKGHLTRSEIGAVLARKGIAAEGQRLGHIAMHCELDAVICSGMPKGKQQTYALVDERAPDATTLPNDEALYEFTKRYFTSHGPASVKDLQAWSSLTLADIKRGVEMVGTELERETLDGVTYLSAPGRLPPKMKSPTAHLLQGYDEYIMGYKETRHWLGSRGGSMMSYERTAMVGIIIVDGEMVGHWKRKVGKETVTFDVFLYRSLVPREQKALQSAADAQAMFLGLAIAAVTPVGL
jgi:hypothetical protein